MRSLTSVGGVRRIVSRLGFVTALVALAAVLAAGGALAASGGAQKAVGAAKATACPFPGGQIRAFGTNDVNAVAGDIGPSVTRAYDIWLNQINTHGGVLGCKLVVDIVDEPFPDVQKCLRNYRTAIASKKYDFFFSPFNSACMAVVPELTNKAGKAIIANLAADHQPFLEKFQKYNFHAAVSTFLEGRGTAVYAKSKGWKNVSVITPNYSYGTDYANAFMAYFLRIVPGSKIVAKQYPAFGEKNIAPFVNAALAPKPDAVIGGEFSTDVLTVWKAWLSQGVTTPSLWLIGEPTTESVTAADQIPANSYGFIRGFWSAAAKTPVGKQFVDLYIAKFGKSKHPEPSGWSLAAMSGLQFAKAIIEKTGSLKADDWVTVVEKGTFTFGGPYNAKPTKVDPITHMADNCVLVGAITWDPASPVKATYNLKDSQNVCLHDVLTPAEAKTLVAK